MDKIAVAKKATSMIACAGTSKIVKEIIANNVTIETKTDKVIVWVASICIAGMAKDKTRVYTDGKIDRAVEWFKKHTEEIQEETPEVTV